ncbi:OX-2 membrane glycoprotein-like isoform X2 [Cololabis saira]|uniref:OX-2 membrane glycoprotein-like isoform X2 n=1 Tax=Cololabis saira TaxID=129043 RepID=UPI002AD1E07F|nr:OX-2 membrane glycoprotein-like isoform X2 [Cololabis saira]
MGLQPGCRTGSEPRALVPCTMSGPALPLYLLLWILGAAVSTTLCQVIPIGPASLTAEAGDPLVLGCNITTETGDTVRQVRWVNKHGKLLLAYEQGAKFHVSHNEPNVQLTTSHSNSSYITISRARPDDSGCYRCIFDIYPGGLQQASTCITVTGKVHLDGNRTAISGQPVTLSCWYSLPQRVRQVLWRKTAEQGDTATVASFATNSPHTEEQFKDRVSLSQTLGDTQLTIRRVQTEDEGCYTCEFHTYPDGTKSAAACLSIYVLPTPEVSHVTLPSGVTEANCTAQSRPAAEITWDVGGENRTMGPPISSVYDQGDGTTIVTSTLLFQAALLSERSVKCLVHHPGLEKPMVLALNTHGVRPAVIVLLSVCGVAAVLLLCLCVCLCKCFICTED